MTETRRAVEAELEWLFREQPTDDYGIDAQIEVVADDVATGKLLALQIKGGASWFREPGPDGWWYRPKTHHVAYWLNHSLPMLIVLFHPGHQRCYWELVNKETLVTTSTGGYKVLIPEDHTLDRDARARLGAAAEGDPYVLRIRDLQFARPWMLLLRDGARLVIDIEEWVNKTSGRGSITLGVDNEDGNPPVPLATWSVLLGLASYAEVVPRLFAWADVAEHSETYELHRPDDANDDEGPSWLAIEHDAEPGSGDDEMLLQPYDNMAGEVDLWRLELTLNELGRAFLLVDSFASAGVRQLTP